MAGSERPNSNANRRHKQIFQLYQEKFNKFLEENKRKVQYTSMRYIYDEIAEEMNYSSEYIAKLIKKQLKG